MRHGIFMLMASLILLSPVWAGEVERTRCLSFGGDFDCTTRTEYEYTPLSGPESAAAALLNALREERASRPQVIYEPVVIPQPVVIPTPPRASDIDFNALPDQPVLASRPPITRRKFCPVGGEIYAEEVKFCPNHGVELRYMDY